MKREKKMGPRQGSSFIFPVQTLFHCQPFLKQTGFPPYVWCKMVPLHASTVRRISKGLSYFWPFFYSQFISKHWQINSPKSISLNFDANANRIFSLLLSITRERRENQFTKLSLIAAAVMIRKDSMTLRKWTCEEPKKILLPRCLVRKKRLFH